jgi:hypothetical protein
MKLFFIRFLIVWGIICLVVGYSDAPLVGVVLVAYVLTHMVFLVYNILQIWIRLPDWG